MYILETELRSSDLAVSSLTPEPFNHPHLNNKKSILHDLDLHITQAFKIVLYYPLRKFYKGVLYCLYFQIRTQASIKIRADLGKTEHL